MDIALAALKAQPERNVGGAALDPGLALLTERFLSHKRASETFFNNSRAARSNGQPSDRLGDDLARLNASVEQWLMGMLDRPSLELEDTAAPARETYRAALKRISDEDDE